MRVARGLVLTFLCAVSVSALPPAHLSSADVVLLAESKDDMAVEASLREALLDADPQTRLIAGRVIASGNRRALLANLVAALVREQDPNCGAELERDVLAVTGNADPELMARQAARLGGGATIALAEWLGRMQPARFVASLAGWVAAKD